jgi:hypothetical protein
MYVFVIPTEPTVAGERRDLLFCAAPTGLTFPNESIPRAYALG